MLFVISLSTLSAVASATFPQAINSSLNNPIASEGLPSPVYNMSTPSEAYIFLMSTDGTTPVSGFSNGQVVSVKNSEGYVVDAVAITSQPNETISGYQYNYFVNYSVGGFGASGYSSYSVSYATNSTPNTKGVYDTFNVTVPGSMTVVIPLSGRYGNPFVSPGPDIIKEFDVQAEQSGIPPLTSVISGSSGPPPTVLYLNPGTYTIFENTSNPTAGSASRNADLLVVITFAPGASPLQGSNSSGVSYGGTLPRPTMNMTCSPNPVPAAGNVTCSVSVSASTAPTGTVSFSGSPSGGSFSEVTRTHSSGTAATIYRPNGATYTVTAQYSGDTRTAPATATFTGSVQVPGYASNGATFTYSGTNSTSITLINVTPAQRSYIDKAASMNVMDMGIFLGGTSENYANGNLTFEKTGTSNYRVAISNVSIANATFTMTMSGCIVSILSGCSQSGNATINTGSFTNQNYLGMFALAPSYLVALNEGNATEFLNTMRAGNFNASVNTNQTVALPAGTFKTDLLTLTAAQSSSTYSINYSIREWFDKDTGVLVRYNVREIMRGPPSNYNASAKAAFGGWNNTIEYVILSNESMASMNLPPQPGSAPSTSTNPSGTGPGYPGYNTGGGSTPASAGPLPMVDIGIVVVIVVILVAAYMLTRNKPKSK